jgi:hypothetical protein
MTVQVRLPRGDTLKRRARHNGRAEHHSPRPNADSVATTPRRRQGGPTQDTALYKCQCGYVFEAAVSTSVGCPHCGDKQAW